MRPTSFQRYEKTCPSDLQGQSNQLNTRFNVGKLLRQSHSVCSPDSAEWIKMLFCNASLCSGHCSRIAFKTACFRNIGLENTRFARLFCKFWFYLSHACSLFISSCDIFGRPIIWRRNSYTDIASCLAREYPMQS